jgi:hypothetical protein
VPTGETIAPTTDAGRDARPVLSGADLVAGADVETEALANVPTGLV